MRRLRVAFLAPEFVSEMVGEGGLASYLNKMARALMAEGHEVEVCNRSANGVWSCQRVGILFGR